MLPAEFSSWAVAGPGWLFTALAVVLLLTGKLYTKAHVKELTAERDRQIKALREEADRWMRAFLLSEEGSRELRDQLSTTLEQGELTVMLLQSIKGDERE